MTKFISWNIDSLNAALTSDSQRAGLSRKVLDGIREENPDFIAIQETKLPFSGMTGSQTEVINKYFPEYLYFSSSSQPPARKGYAGTMILYRKEIPVKLSVPKIGAPDTMDLEGRIIQTETEDFFLVNVYTPNSGDGLKRLLERTAWDDRFSSYLHSLDLKKPVISCGDFNVAHEEIDLANPDTNHFSAGFTDEERRGFSHLLSQGFTDTFRYIHGRDFKEYSWWSQRARDSKKNNTGWRIDYFLVSDRITSRIKQSSMLPSGDRKDHTPIMLVTD